MFRCNLVLTSRRLAGLELVQVPATDSQTTLVLVHALAEALDIVCARTRLRHLSRRRVSGLVLGGEFSVFRRGFGGGRGTASKPAADCVANGGSYCDTAVQSALVKSYCIVCGPKFLFAMFLRMTTSWQRGGATWVRNGRMECCLGGSTYAAVLAICPNRPGPWGVGA